MHYLLNVPHIYSIENIQFYNYKEMLELHAMINTIALATQYVS